MWKKKGLLLGPQNFVEPFKWVTINPVIFIETSWWMITIIYGPLNKLFTVWNVLLSIVKSILESAHLYRWGWLTWTIFAFWPHHYLNQLSKIFSLLISI